MEKRAIDIVREEMNKRRTRCKTKEEEETIDRYIRFLNWNDYVFFEINAKATIVLFEVMGINGERAIELFDELTSEENYKKYKEFVKRKKLGKSDNKKHIDDNGELFSLFDFYG